jgi:hypothetical protein
VVGSALAEGEAETTPASTVAIAESVATEGEVGGTQQPASRDNGTKTQRTFGRLREHLAFLRSIICVPSARGVADLSAKRANSIRRPVREHNFDQPSVGVSRQQRQRHRMHQAAEPRLALREHASAAVRLGDLRAPTSLRCRHHPALGPAVGDLLDPEEIAARIQPRTPVRG